PRSSRTSISSHHPDEPPEPETMMDGELEHMLKTCSDHNMNHQTRVYNDVFEMLPSEENPSPMVRIHRLNPSPEFTLYAKLEWMNPFGSVKDRAAWAMLRDLERHGEVGNGRGLVEPTSGNTGISLAAMARARGYHMRAVVPNKVPLEKKVLLKIAGA